MFATAAYVGARLASDLEFATLPVGLHLGGTLAAVIPASLLMKRIGRRKGFAMGSLLGIAGSLLAAYAIMIEHFGWYCAGAGCMGLFNGFGTYYRFAAAEAAPSSSPDTAISYVLAGGVIAALLGPNLARWTMNITTQPFAGCYLALAAVYAGSLVAILFVQFPSVDADRQQRRTRTFLQFVRQPQFPVAILAGVIGYAVMNLIMTSTPLMMHEHRHSFDAAASVIQWHMLGMFAPSFLTPRLIGRIGLVATLQGGAVLCALCVALNLLSTDFRVLVLALTLLGVGWNFLAVSAASLLVQICTPEERAKTQAINDFLMLAAITTTALCAAGLLQEFGWNRLNLGAGVVLAIIPAAVMWLQAVRTKTEEIEISTS